jgi:hypothetical protein
MKRSIVAVVLAICVVVAGCGGSGDDSGPLTAASYKAEAEAACKQMVQGWSALYQKVSREHKNTSDLSQAAQHKLLVDEIILPPLEKLVGDLSELQAPAGGSAKVEDAVVSFKAVMEKGQANPDELADGQLLAEARQEAAAAGLKSCSPSATGS